MANEFRFVDLVDNFPPIIIRTQIKDYFPWLSPKRMANLDSIGKGPPSVKNGRVVVYSTAELLGWLDTRNSPRGENNFCAQGSVSPRDKEGKVPKKLTKCGRKKKEQEVRERRGLD